MSKSDSEKPSKLLTAFSQIDDDDEFSLNLSTVQVVPAETSEKAEILQRLSSKLSEYSRLFKEERERLERGLVDGKDSAILFDTFFGKVEGLGD